MYGHTYSKSMDQPGKVASPARGQLNRKNEYFLVRVRAWEFCLARRVTVQWFKMYVALDTELITNREGKGCLV